MVRFLQQCCSLPFLLDRGLQSGGPAGWLKSAVAGRRRPSTAPSAKHLSNLGQRPTIPPFSCILSSSVLCSLPFFFFTSPVPSSLAFLLILSFYLISSTGPQALCTHALFLHSYFEVSVLKLYTLVKVLKLTLNSLSTAGYP